MKGVVKQDHVRKIESIDYCVNDVWKTLVKKKETDLQLKDISEVVLRKNI